MCGVQALEDFQNEAATAFGGFTDKDTHRMKREQILMAEAEEYERHLVPSIHPTLQPWREGVSLLAVMKMLLESKPRAICHTVHLDAVAYS